MSSFFGPAMAGNRRQRCDDACRVVDRQRRLRHVGELAGRDVEPLDVAADSTRCTPPPGPSCLRPPGARVADHHDLAPVLAHLGDLDVHLGHQRAGRVEHGEAAARRLGLHRLRDAVRREHDGRAARHSVEFVDEHRALALQVLDDGPVVHDLVAHVDRRTVLSERLLDDRDRAIDAGTESAGVGEQDVHGIRGPRARRRAVGGSCRG
jgi:hypothetical protein